MRLYHNGDLNLAVGSVDDRLLAAVGAVAVLGRVLLVKKKLKNIKMQLLG